MILLKLFWSFFQIGLFSIGGGYATLPLIQDQIVDLHQWLSLSELADIIAISQMTPGPIALNAATFVGIKIAGLAGGVIATLGCIFPSCVIVVILARHFFKNRELAAVQGILMGLRPAVGSLIAVAGLSVFTMAVFNQSSDLWRQFSLADIDLIALGIFVTAFFVIRKFKASILSVMAGSAVVGIALYLWIG